MFNDILNGKRTLEQEPVAKDPYRPDPGPSDLICTSCQLAFPASQAVAGRCRNCAPPVDAALAALRGPKADYTDYGAQDRKRDFGLALIVVSILAVLAIGFFVARYKMRQQRAEDLRDEQMYERLDNAFPRQRGLLGE